MKLGADEVRTPEEYAGSRSYGLRPSKPHPRREMPRLAEFLQQRVYWHAERHLRAPGIFRSLGAVRGKEVVIYCTAGMRASHAFAVAESLGLNVRFYGGSMSDWITDSRRPVKLGHSP